MIRLSPEDASVLARVAQYDHLPTEKRRRMVLGLSGKARAVACVLLGEDSRDPEVLETAEALRKWSRNNRAFATRRPDEGDEYVPAVAYAGRR